MTIAIVIVLIWLLAGLAAAAVWAILGARTMRRRKPQNRDVD